MKKGLTCGAFDLCHAGHMQMFRECKTACDYLIVGLQDDPSITDPAYRGKKKNRPVMTLAERYEVLRAIKYIDEIFTYTTEEDLLENIKLHDHDVRILGADWKGKYATGQELAKQIYYNSRGHHYSTTELRERIYYEEKRKRDAALQEARFLNPQLAS